MSNKIKVLIIPSDVSGVGHFRSIWPAKYLKKNNKEDFIVKIDSRPDLNNINYLTSFDIIHFHRQMGPYENSNELFQKIKEKGTILIMDIDDYWNPPPTHPLYELVKKEKINEKVENNLRLVDWVTTTTDIFADKIRKFNKNVFVIPNSVDYNSKMWRENEPQEKPKKPERTRVAWIGGSCYDEKTEVLTDEGFKFFKDLSGEEKVATLNPENNNLEYHKPNNYISEPFEGKLQCGASNLIDYAVTPNHKMYVSQVESLTQKNINFKLIDSKDVFKTNLHFKKDAIWEGKDEKEFIIPAYQYIYETNFQDVYEEFLSYNTKLLEPERASKKIKENAGSGGVVVDVETAVTTKVSVKQSSKGNYYLRKDSRSEIYNSPIKLNMKLWLKFFGFWMAEGWTSKTDGLFQIGIAQSKDNNYLEEQFNTLNKLGFNPCYTKDKKQIRFFNKQVWEYLSQFGTADTKFVPQEILSLSPNLLNIFLEWFLKGDGSKESCGRIRGYTCSKQLADNIQEICLKIGVLSTVTNRGKRNAVMLDGRKITAKHDAYVISIGSNGVRSRKTPLLRAEKQFEQDYIGKVYCVNVKHNIIYVRRNGKTMWCGNSHMFDLQLLSESMELFSKDEELRKKAQIVMCGFDVRGEVTEIAPDGSRRKRPIQPHETVWLNFEKIFTNNYELLKDNPEYIKWLHRIQKEGFENQYEQNYVRRWTQNLNSYAEHYNYCDICLAPLTGVYYQQVQQGNKMKMLERPHTFNHVKSELKVVEAGMKKKALIAQDFGIYAKTIEHGKTGLLVKNNKKGWYEAIKELVENPEYREELANNLHEWVKEEYSNDKINALRTSFYKKIINEKSL